MGLMDWLRGGKPVEVLPERASTAISFDAWAGLLQEFGFNGHTYTLGGSTQEEPTGLYSSVVQTAYKTNGVVFACMLVRMLLFAEARFQFRRLRSGRPGELFGTDALLPLETPWPGGTTGDLMSRAIQYADLAGNAFVARRGRELAMLRPDWVDILVGSERDTDVVQWDVDARAIGYVYYPGGKQSGRDAVVFASEEVAHFAPIPDPVAQFRGMSWITPLYREVMADKAMTDHKLAFMEHAATPNMVVKIDTPDVAKFREWTELFREKYEGSSNAYKTLFLAQGFDATPVGADFQQMEFKITQGAGEPLALDTPIPTPDGWTTMGEIEPGEFVFGRTGAPARVAAVSPIHVGRDCFRVTFSDQTSIIADANHVWQVIDRATGSNNVVDGVRRRPESQMTTAEIATGIEEWRAAGKTQARRYGIPAGDPVELDDKDLLVDPYVLGAWLGDGATAGAAICGAQPDLEFIASEIEARGYTVSRWNTAADKVDVIGIPGGLLAALDALGVLGNKHIPAEYLRASMTQRLDLLRGLMDTDGTVGSIGKESCEFSSKWEHLARQVAELSRSLGYRATVSSRKDARSRTGLTWRVTFRADPDVVPFLLERKAERCVTPVWVKNRAIVSVEPVDSVPVRCISVETPDHLFRAGEGWTLTHNTRIAAAAGVPPVIVGLSEGLQAATYSNYGQARRRFADGTMSPLWRNMCGSLSRIIDVPSGTELAVDMRDIPFLKEDQKDAAQIQAMESATIRTLVDGGFEPDSVVQAVVAGDLSRLKHTGKLSVQLQEPGTVDSPGDTNEPVPAGNGTNSVRDMAVLVASLVKPEE